MQKVPGVEEKSGMSLEQIKEALRQEEEGKKLLETVTRIDARLERVEEQQNSFCDPSSGQCFPTQALLEQHFRRLEAKIPKIMDGAQDLTSFFQNLSEDKDKIRPYKVLSERMPTKLKVGLVKYLCKDGECKIALEQDGIHVHDGEQPQRGAYPGR